MTDLIATRRVEEERLAKCFPVSCPLEITQESSCAFPNIWPHVSAWVSLKGIRVGQSVSVSVMAPC